MNGKKKKLIKEWCLKNNHNYKKMKKVYNSFTKEQKDNWTEGTIAQLKGE